MQNSIRTEMQGRALEHLKTKRRLLLNWGTEVGKSRVAVKAMQMILAANPDATFLLMVQETTHKINWKNEFTDALGQAATEAILARTTMDCYASLKKHENTDWDLIIFDEGHHLRSPKRMNVIKTMKARRVLILTATAKDNNDGEEMLSVLEHTFGHFDTMSFCLQEGIDSSILGEPRIHLVPVVLDDDRSDKYDSLTQYQEKKKNEYYKRRFELNLEHNDPDNDETSNMKSQWLFAGNKRKRFLGNAKTAIARKLISGPLKNKRFICFCASVDQIGWLNGSNYVCGHLTAKQNNEAIRNFNDGTKDHLFAMGMLQEGQNLKNIECGLIIQLDSKQRPFVQKFGRVMRAKNPELYIIYFVDTQDEKYLENAISEIKKEYIIKHDPIFPDGSPAQTTTANERVSLEKLSRTKWVVDTGNGLFVNLDGTQKNTLQGKLLSIGDAGESKQLFSFDFLDIRNETINSILVKKTLSIGLVAPLMELSSPGNETLEINISKSGAWPQYSVFRVSKHSKNKVNWKKGFIENYPKETDNKIRYIETNIRQINQKISNF